MTTRAEIKAIVSDEVSRQSVLDTKIDTRIFWAVRWLERNYSLQFMHRFVDFELAVDTRSVQLPSEPKRFEFIRYTGTNGYYQYLPKVAPQDVTRNEQKNPTGWWLDGVQFIRFDNAPPEALPMEMLYWQYTVAFTDDADTTWSFDSAQDVIVAQTMKFMLSLMKKPEDFALYKDMRDEGLRTLLLADAELDQGARDNTQSKAGEY